MPVEVSTEKLAEGKAMSQHTVEIDVNEGNFTYRPTLLRVRRGDTVKFTSNCHAFEVMFKERSPGELFLFNGDNTLTICATAEYAVYHYAAAVYNRHQDRVYLDSACGDIAVDK